MILTYISGLLNCWKRFPLSLIRNISIIQLALRLDIYLLELKPKHTNNTASSDSCPKLHTEKLTVRVVWEQTFQKNETLGSVSPCQFWYLTRKSPTGNTNTGTSFHLRVVDTNSGTRHLVPSSNRFVSGFLIAQTLVFYKCFLLWSLCWLPYCI
jgi:hypothetical protein